jgi:hypothetical protein
VLTYTTHGRAWQGFTKEITMPREEWVGYIKDYDGGTLMEYVIHPKIPYADLVGMFKASAHALVCWGWSNIEHACCKYGQVRLRFESLMSCVQNPRSWVSSSMC